MISGPDYPLCRLYHGRGPPSQGGPRRSAANFLPRCFDVWTFSVRLNVMTTKKGRHLLWGKSAPPQIRKSWLRVREKGPRLTLVWGPRMVNLALIKYNCFKLVVVDEQDDRTKMKRKQANATKSTKTCNETSKNVYHTISSVVND